MRRHRPAAEDMKATIREKLNRYLLPAAVLLFLTVFFILCRGRIMHDLECINHPYGYADIRGCDFDREVYHLDNNWDYFPGKLLTPADFADPSTAPQPENDVPIRIDPELGSYRIRLLTRPHQWLAICGFSVDFSTRVFLNGEEVRNIGYVSADPEKAVPKVRYMTIPMYSGESGEIELIYQYSNFVHHEGGFVQATLISTPENIDECRRGITFYYLLISSGLTFLMFWFLLSASIQKSREFTALAFCCLVIALRNQFFFAEFMIDPGYDFFWEYRVNVLAVSLIPVSALFLLYAFFPKAMGKKTGFALAGLFAVLTALHWIVGTKDLVGLCHVSYYSCLPFLLWCIFCLLKYFIRVERPERPELITLGVLAFFIVMLIREGVSSGSSQSIVHFGIMPTVLAVCLMILAVVINARIRRQMRGLQQEEERARLLEQVNDMNRDFLRMVAHELKTPLTVISGYAQLTERQLEKYDKLEKKEGAESDPRERNRQLEKMTGRLKTIQNESERLGNIVTRLMDYTYNRVNDAEMTAVNTEDLLNSAGSVMSPVCAKNDNTLIVRDHCSCRVKANYELLLQVLINLIANAGRHTKKGVITVETEEGEKEAVFLVKDTGSGILPEAVPHIFEKGYTTGQGNGLGLAICKETVQLHGGELTLVSTGAEGTVFRFTIPYT